MTRSTHAALFIGALLLLGCGAATPSPSIPTASVAPDDAGDWTAAHLRRLDAELRAHVEQGTSERLAIKVYFSNAPSDDELSALLLSRVGRQVVGSVELAMLHEIAGRDDVDRIEALNDTGY